MGPASVAGPFSCSGRQAQANKARGCAHKNFLFTCGLDLDKEGTEVGPLFVLPMRNCKLEDSNMLCMCYYCYELQ
jgi:hypothetical protein